MEKLIADYVAGRTALITRLLFIIAASSALFTFKGASIDAEGFSDVAQASVFAIAGGAAIFGFWHVILKIIPRLSTPGSRTLAYSLSIPFLLLIVCLSGFLNVAGLAGEEALEVHIAEYINSAERRVDEAFQSAMIVSGVSADIRSEVSRYEYAAASELNSGAYSGSGGPGAVVNALNAIRGRFITLSHEADEYLSQAESLGEKARARLEKIRKIASSDKALHIRTRDISRESDALRADLARMDVSNFAEALERMLSALPREVDLQASFSANPAVAQRQRAALDKVREDIEFSARKMNGFLQGPSASPTIRVEGFERISAIKAVLVYWDNFLPYWAGGIALDLFPMAIVIFLSIAISSKTSHELSIIRMMNRRFSDVFDIKIIERAMRYSRNDLDTIHSIYNQLLGIEHRKPENDASGHEGEEQ